MLLQEIARRLKHCVRGSDTVARIGGDEFVVLLESAGVEANAVTVAAKIHDTVGQADPDQRHAVEVLPSIGVALCPEHGSNGEALLKYVDEAIYKAKPGAR